MVQALGKRSPEGEEGILLSGRAVGADRQLQQMLVLGQLLQQISERRLRPFEITLLEHRLDRGHQHFPGLRGITGRYHGTAHNGPHFEVAGFGFEDLVGHLHGPGVLTHPHEGAHEKILQLGRVRRPFDPKVQKLEGHRSSSGVEERLARRNQERAIGRILFDHTAIEALRIVQLPRFQQYCAEARVNLERRCRVFATKQ